MDSATKKSFELQAKVRHNAEVFKNTLNDLYNWEKEQKDKEQTIKNSPPDDVLPELQNVKTLPVRSHSLKQANKAQQQEKQKQQQTPVVKAGGSAINRGKGAVNVSATAEKAECPLDPNQEKRKRANEHKDRGNNAVKMAKYTLAIREYTAAIEIFPEDAIFYSNRALCHLKLARNNECIEDCGRAIDIDSLAVKAYYRRMQANENLGFNLDALKDCTTVLKIDPKNFEAKKSLERINNKLRKTAKSTNGPNFSEQRENMIEIVAVDKPPHKRSNKALRRVPVVDIVGPKDVKNAENVNLKISDDDIDKLFNSNCGPFVEVKSSSDTDDSHQTKPAAGTPVQKIPKPQSAPRADAKKAEAEASKVKSNEMEARAHQIGKKPLGNSEAVSSGAGKINTRSNPVAVEAASSTVQPAESTRPLPPAPTTTSQFYSHWKELTPVQKYQYFKSIKLGQLNKILGAGFDSATLTEVLKVLRDQYVPNNEPTTAAALLEISKNSQIFILSMLMSSDECKVLKEIIAAIKQNADSGTAAMIKTISKNFGL